MTHRTSVLALVALIGITTLHLPPAHNMQTRERIDQHVIALTSTEEELQKDLLTACKFADWIKVADVLAKCPKLAVLTGRCGKSPLYNVCSGTVAPLNQVAIINLLIGAGAPVDDCYGKNMASALHAACLTGCSSRSTRVVKLLLDHQAPVNYTDKKKKTPLHYACWHGGDSAMVEALCEAASNQNVIDVINFKDKKGNTALHYASHCIHYSPNLPAIKTLLKQDAIDINATNNEGKTPLHVLCSTANGNEVSSAIRFLLEKSNIDISIEDEKCKTALAYYIERYELDREYGNDCHNWTLKAWKKHFDIPAA